MKRNLNFITQKITKNVNVLLHLGFIILPTNVKSEGKHNLPKLCGFGYEPISGSD